MLIELIGNCKKACGKKGQEKAKCPKGYRRKGMSDKKSTFVITDLCILQNLHYGQVRLTRWATITFLLYNILPMDQLLTFHFGPNHLCVKIINYKG